MAKRPIQKQSPKDPPSKTVFISSTYSDLATHRRAVWDVIESFNVAVRGMETFGARPTAPLATCLAEVDQSDIYVGIIAFRLGSVDKETGKSFTQLEYERAEKAGKTVLIYLADEQSAVFPYAAIDVDGRRRALTAFKQTLKERHTVSTFSTAEDLSEKIKGDFSELLEPKAPAVVAAGDEFAPTVKLVRRFLLLPNTVLGRAIRLRVKCSAQPFPASRSLCKAFNFEYGDTIGVHVHTVKPDDKDVRRFRELYASGRRAEELLKIIEARGATSPRF